jgi:acyl-[acyl-carrier-protein]-phospholipid O-acyltransferase/long-chain-fatty-acid--[acyl-carrier-protein] ligase
VAFPGLPFESSTLGIHHSIRDVLRRDRVLLGALLVSSLFWFVGGVIQPAVNELGKNRLGLNDGRTSVMLAWMATGIAAGCAAAAKLSHHRINVKLITWLGISAPAPLPLDQRSASSMESMWTMIATAGGREWGFRVALAGVGFFGGLFIVPLQVLIQTRPPEDLKGRMIGAMNLANWMAIVFSAVFFGLCGAVLSTMNQTVGSVTFTPISWIFAALGVCLIPVAIFYRPNVESVPGQH